MACLNTCPFLAATGVGVFSRCNNSDTIMSINDASASINDARANLKTATRVLTAINIAGWIPGVSLISGIASICLGVFFGFRQRPVPKLFTASLIIRGILQIAQVGIILAPFDIGFSIARLVREHLKNKAAHSLSPQ